MKNLLFFLFGSLFLLSGCASSEDTPKQNYKQISQSEAAEILETEEEYILLDVRTPEKFAQGHIPGAVCIPNESITTKESPKELPDKDQKILVYCRSGNRSRQAAEKLAKLGYSQVLEFGGIIDWEGEIVSGEQTE